MRSLNRATKALSAEMRNMKARGWVKVRPADIRGWKDSAIKARRAIDQAIIEEEMDQLQIQQESELTFFSYHVDHGAGEVRETLTLVLDGTVSFPRELRDIRLEQDHQGLISGWEELFAWLEKLPKGSWDIQRNS